MESFYGRMRPAANEGERETWMDRFTQLEPEGGFQAAVRQAWSRTARTSHGGGSLISLNWRTQVEPVYGQSCVSPDAGVRETWMARFTKLEPEGGFRTVVKQAWRVGADIAAPHRLLAA